MRLLLSTLLFLLSFLIIQEEALATAPPSELVLIPDICSGDDIIKANRIAGNIVRCVEHVVNEKADEMIHSLISDFSYIVFHVVILGIMVFFARVMFGVARARGVLSLFTIKVILVLFVANPDNSQIIIDWKDALLDFPKDISLNILDAVKSPVSGTNIEAEDVFDRLDLYVMRMMGIDETTLSPDRNSPNEFYIGVAAMIAGLFFTGAIGAAISAVSIGFVIAVLMAVAQAVLFYCTIIIALNFLAAIAPITVTCLLFQPTKKITTQWFQYCLIYIVQPMILMTVLGLTMGIIDGVVSNFDDPHDKILGKWENTDGKNQHAVKVFDCSKLNISAGSLLNMFGKSNFMGDIVSQAALSDQSFNRYTMGQGSIGVDTGFSADDMKINFASNCELKVPALQIDFNQSNLDDANLTENLTEEDLRQLMGTKLAITSLLIMLISFLVKMPEMVNMMVGQGVIAELSKYSSSPLKTGKETLYGSGDGSKKGILQNAMGSLNSQYAERSSGFKPKG